MVEFDKNDLRVKIEKNYAIIESLDKMKNILLRDQEIISNGIQNISKATTTLKGLSEENGKSETEMLIPIGGGAFIPISTERPKKVILKIGAGVSIEKDLDQAISALEERSKDLENGLSEVLKKILDIEEKENLAIGQLNELKEMLES